jgi:hypothetical protein
LLKEYKSGNNCISLVFLDIRERSLQKLHTFEYPTSTIFVNKADLNTFILTNGEFIQICKVVDNTIIIGERIEIEIDLNPSCFYDKCVYALTWNDELDVRIWELAKTPESQNSRITKLPITKLPNHKTPDQVNVRQINGVFSKFLLQTVLSQSGSYYLIRTRVEPDIVLPVNIFRYE